MSKKLSKVLALVLALAMVLALAACGGNTTTNDNQTNNNTNETQTNTENNTTTPDTTTPDTTTPDNTETTTPDDGEQGNQDGEEVDEGPKFLTVYGEGTYERGDEEEIYEYVLGDYEQLMEEAHAATNISEKFVLYAKAEAYLLDSAVMIPTTTQGGAYTISRVAPHTVPYVQWGNDDDRLFGLVISGDDFLTKEERADLLAQWSAAVAAQDSSAYDPAGYLTSHGHTVANTYNTTFSTAPVTIDWLNTSSQSDTEITVNTVEGLVQYDNVNVMQPALAESWEISEDGLTYTFHIREGAYWYTSSGDQYAEVTANDFVAGFHHMLDTDAGLDWLVDGVIVGVHEYIAEGGSYDNVGYQATDKNTLVVTLEEPTSYFMTMLTYSIFLPICESFYLSRGGVYGRDAYQAATEDTNAYTFGLNTDVASQVYCGPFILNKLQADSEIVLVKNPNYYNADKVTLDKITWIYDAGENPDQTYNDVINGVYAGTGLSESSGTLAKAKEAGLFDKYSYVSDTTSTSYFGGLNVDRGTFGLESGAATSAKTEEQKIDTAVALSNKNFRKALQHAFDKATQNAVLRGADLATTNLRNMYTHPEFVSLEEDVTYEGHTFTAGTFYGEIVQYFCDEMGCLVNVADQVDGWFNPEAAKNYLAAAKEELGDAVTFPIIIDVVYYGPSVNITAQAQAYKQVIENTLGAENVTVNLIETTTADDYYACGYRAANGEAGNFDMFYGSGWGPDFGDPCTYLDTFLGYGEGYMTKVIGLF